jgi:copper chaperone
VRIGSVIAGIREIPIGGMGMRYNKEEERSYMENTLSLAIDGMHCGACIRRVTSALQCVEGVTVNAVEIGSAQLAFNPTEITTQDITATLDRNGFPARVRQ